MSNILLQISEMPQAGGDHFLLWAIGILVAAMGSVFALYLGATRELKKAFEERVTDRDKQIDILRAELASTRAEKDRLLAEIKPSLEAANSIAKSIERMLTK